MQKSTRWWARVAAATIAAHCLSAASAAPLTLSEPTAAAVDDVLVFGPSWSSSPPQLALEAVAIPAAGTPGSAAPDPTPVPVWENFAQIPRAVEPIFAEGASEDAPPNYFFGDTQGSLWFLETGVKVHQLLPRVPDKGVENSILSLAFDKSTHQLYFTVNTTIKVMTVSKDGTTVVKPPTVVADFAPRGVQSLVVLWPKDGSVNLGVSDQWDQQPAAAPEAFFCVFNNANRSDGGSLVRAPLTDPTRYTLLVNETLSVVSGRPFGDALPRMAIDTEARRIYFPAFGRGVQYVDIDAPDRPKFVPIAYNYRSSSVYLSLAVVPAPDKAQNASAVPFLILSSLRGSIGMVPVSGGPVGWIDSPCLPQGGCRYRQLWDMKVLPPSPAPVKANVTARGDDGNRINGAAAKRPTLAAAWIRVTDIDPDDYQATILDAAFPRLFLTAGPLHNYTQLNMTVDYQTWHHGNSGISVRPDQCTAFYTQSSHSSIYSSPMDPLQPVNTSYTYHNFRFNPNFAIDTQRDRAWWMQQYDNPHAAGDNGYALQLMSADLDNLDGRTSVLTAICNTHAGQLFVDPTSGDTVFQSYGAGSTYSVQHYCYRKASGGLARHFYTQTESYTSVNVAVDWKHRAMFVSGTAYRSSESAIRKVSIDAPSPADNPEVVIAPNTSANAMAVAGGSLYYVQVSSYGRLKLTSSVLYACHPIEAPADCRTDRATNLSSVPWAFSDQFSSIQLFAPDDTSLVFTSARGNSIAKVISRYEIGQDSQPESSEASKWEPVWVSPFNQPAAIGGDPSKYFYIDGSLSTFGEFVPTANPDAFNVPFEITGHAQPLSALGTSQPYPNGASGGWGVQFTAGKDTWYWYSPSATQADRIGLFSANMAAPVPKEILVLPHNSSTSVLAVDESEQHLYYVRRTNTRPGVCGSWPGGVADNVVRVSLDGSGEEVLLEQPKGWCVGTASVALDSAGRKLYYNIVDQYSQFMGYSHLAVLDLATGKSTLMDWGMPRNSNHKILRLNDDATSLWSWACVPNRFGDGCSSQMFVIDISPTSPSSNNWTNATLPPLGPGAYQSGLTDFSLRGQPKNKVVFSAYFRPSTYLPTRGIFQGRYVPAATIETSPMLQPVDFANIDVDAADADHGLLVAATPPPNFDGKGVLLLRGPIAGVGRADGTTLEPTIIPWPADLPVSLQASNMQQLDFQPPNKLVFAWGRYNCMQDELWQTELSPAGGAIEPTQFVSALLSGGLLQAASDGNGGATLTWVKCSARVVIAEVPAGVPADKPLDYATLKHAWLRLDTWLDPPSSSSLTTVARVGDDFIFGYGNGAVVHAVLEHEQGLDYHFVQSKLLMNESSWLPTTSTVYGERVFLGQRNATGSNGRILSIELDGRGGKNPPLPLRFLHHASSVADLGCLRSSASRAPLSGCSAHAGVSVWNSSHDVSYHLRFTYCLCRQSCIIHCIEPNFEPIHFPKGFVFKHYVLAAPARPHT